MEAHALFVIPVPIMALCLHSEQWDGNSNGFPLMYGSLFLSIEKGAI
jgi:hypothetical protein